MIQNRDILGRITGNPKMECVCLICGNRFMEYQSRIKEGRGKTCSFECRVKRTTQFNKNERDYSKENRPKGEDHSGWKGNNVGYVALHDWVRKMIARPLACSNCEGVRKLSLANISGEYKRDLSDWLWLCYSCHKRMDLKEPKNTKNVFLERGNR